MAMRLALFTDTYSPEINGVAKTLERWIGYLRGQGIECMVFAPARPKDKHVGAENAERLMSIPFFLYPELRMALPRSPEAERKLLAFKPTVIHVATPFGTGLAGRSLALKHGIPLVASHHTHFARYLPYYNIQWLGKLLYRYLHWFHLPCLKIYVPSRSVLEDCRRDGWGQLEVWSRGIDGSTFHPNVDREALLASAGIPSRFIALYAGRIAPEKQPEVAVEAVTKFVADTGADAELVIAGEGPGLSELKALAAKRKVRHRFLGSLTQRELQQWMAASDALLFPSATETFGNVMLEAMACGLPVIGADGGAVPDTIRDGHNGMLCAPGDSDAFAKKLALLHADPSLRAKLIAIGLHEASTRTWAGVFDQLRHSISAVTEPRQIAK
ncbi:glycosyltransferase family 4 protein [Cohnella yongneupensis]|uniref:Glycosyltransferase family 4 protein n=1 Tax=Cohnella yongneupensis TaxID=425006 RepID=A0ABW0QV40_9BACL